MDRILPRSLMKAVMTIFSCILVIVAVACITIGSVVTKRSQKTIEIREVANEIGTPGLASGLIVIGIVMLITCVVGILATFTDSHLLSIVYAIGMLLLVVATIAISMEVFKTTDGIDNIIANKINKFWKDRGSADSARDHTSMEGIQMALHCCGRYEPGDYGDGGLPKSCCPKKVDECNPTNAYKDGCSKKLKKYFREFSPCVKYYSMGAVLFEFVGFVIATMYAAFLNSNV